MNWPFVTRRAYDLVAAELVSTKRELHRWQDIVAKQNWGHQIHDTLPSALATAEKREESQVPAQETEEELQAAEHRRDLAELATVARTRKSQLPGMIERLMQKKLVQRARSAVAPSKEAVAAQFQKLKAETLRSIH